MRKVLVLLGVVMLMLVVGATDLAAQAAEAAADSKGAFQVIKEKFPAAELTSDSENLVKSDYDIIVISTPVDTHYNLWKKRLI